MKRVMVFGSFDMLHPGHHYFLREAALKADELIVVVAADDYINTVKGQSPCHNQEQRMEKLRHYSPDYRIVAADKSLGSFQVVREFQPQLIVLGHDQTQLHQALLSWSKEQKQQIEFCLLPAFKRQSYRSSYFRSKHWTFYLLMVLAMIAWASSWSAGRVMVLQKVPLVLTITLRNSLTVIVFAFLYFYKSPKKRVAKNITFPLCLSVVLMLIYFFFYYSGLRLVESGRAGMLVTGLNAFFSALLVSRFSLKYFLNIRGIALLLGSFGVLLAMQIWQFELRLGLALLLLILAGFLWACLTLLSQHIQQSLHGFDYFFYLYLAISIVFLPFALPHLSSLRALPFSYWFSCFWQGVVSAAFGSGFYFYSTKVIGAERSASFSLLVPPLVVIEGMILLKERPHWTIFPATLLIVLALFLLQRANRANFSRPVAQKISK